MIDWKKITKSKICERSNLDCPWLNDTRAQDRQSPCHRVVARVVAFAKTNNTALHVRGTTVQGIGMLSCLAFARFWSKILIV